MIYVCAYVSDSLGAASLHCNNNVGNNVNVNITLPGNVHDISTFLANKTNDLLSNAINNGDIASLYQVIILVACKLFNFVECICLYVVLLIEFPSLRL